MARGYVNVDDLLKEGPVAQMAKALQGDIVIAITPATVTAGVAAVNASGRKRFVNIVVKSADGKPHTFLDGKAITVALTKSSSAGTATIPTTTPKFRNGSITVPISYGGTWAGGTKQKETLTLAGNVSAAGDAEVTVTAAGLAGSPVTLAVAVANADTPLLYGPKVLAALQANTALAAFFTFSAGATANIIVAEAKLAAANDATMELAAATGTATGITSVTSANTTAGVAPDTSTLTVSNVTFAGATITGGTSVETVR